MKPSDRPATIAERLFGWLVGALFIGGLLGWYAAQTFWQHIAAVGALATGFAIVGIAKLMDHSPTAAPTNTQLQNPPPAIREPGE